NACGALARRDFQLDSDIELRTEGNLGRDYEAATIAYKLYERGALPDDDEISLDIESLLVTYDDYINRLPNADITSPPAEVRPIPASPPYTVENALSDLFLEQPELDELLALWHEKKNIILLGAPGVGKTYTASRLAYTLMGHRDKARTRMIQFHQ